MHLRNLIPGLVAAFLFSCGPLPAPDFDDNGLSGDVVVRATDAGSPAPVVPDAGAVTAGGGAGGGNGGGAATAGGAGGSGGGGGGGGAPAAPVSSLAFLFPNLTIARETIELVSDGQGVMHAVFKMLSPTDTLLDERPSALFYARCTLNCGKAASWTQVQIGVGFDPHLAVDPLAQVHVAWATDGGLNGKDTLRYGRCVSNCLVATNWSSLPLVTADWGIRVRGVRPLQVAPNGTVGLAFTAEGDLYVTQCYAACLTSATYWERVLLDDVAGETEASLAFTSASRPRMVAALEDSVALRYFTCDLGCSAPASWTTTTISPSDGNSAVLRLDAQDRPRVLFNQGGAGLASEQYLAWFMGCDNNCTLASNWAGRSVGEEWDGHRGVDLQLVAGSPVVALSTHTGASVFRCTANCSSRQPTFAATPIESDAQLTTLIAPPNLQGCTNPVWDSGNHPSLAVDPTGKHLTVLFEAVSITHCPSYELAADVMRVYDLVDP